MPYLQDGEGQVGHIVAGIRLPCQIQLVAGQVREALQEATQEVEAVACCAVVTWGGGGGGIAGRLSRSLRLLAYAIELNCHSTYPKLSKIDSTR